MGKEKREGVTGGGGPYALAPPLGDEAEKRRGPALNSVSAVIG